VRVDVGCARGVSVRVVGKTSSRNPRHRYVTACEDLLHASTLPQVETARTYELAKCRGNEG